MIMFLNGSIAMRLTYRGGRPALISVHVAPRHALPRPSALRRHAEARDIKDVACVAKPPHGLPVQGAIEDLDAVILSSGERAVRVVPIDIEPAVELGDRHTGQRGIGDA